MMIMIRLITTKVGQQEVHGIEGTAMGSYRLKLLLVAEGQPTGVIIV